MFDTVLLRLAFRGMAFSDHVWNIEEYGHPSSSGSFVVHNLYLPLMYQKSSSTLTLLHDLGHVVIHVHLKFFKYWLVIWLSYTPQWGQIKLIFLHYCDTLNVCCVPNKNTLCLIHIQRYRQTILSMHQLCRHHHDPCMNLNRVIVIHLSLGNCLQWEKQSTQRSYKIEQIQLIYLII